MGESRKPSPLCRMNLITRRAAENEAKEARSVTKEHGERVARGAKAKLELEPKAKANPRSRVESELVARPLIDCIAPLSADLLGRPAGRRRHSIVNHNTGNARVSERPPVCVTNESRTRAHTYNLFACGRAALTSQKQHSRSGGGGGGDGSRHANGLAARPDVTRASLLFMSELLLPDISLTSTSCRRRTEKGTFASPAR